MPTIYHHYPLIALSTFKIASICYIIVSSLRFRMANWQHPTLWNRRGIFLFANNSLYSICVAKAYLMVYNSLTLESWKVRTLREELESNKFWVIFHFLRLKSAISTYLFPPIQANFQEFYMFSNKHCRNYSYMYFITWIGKMWPSWPVKLVKFCFTALHHSVFGKS